MTLIKRLILTLALMAGISPVMAQVPAPVPALPDSERRTSYSITATTCACNVNFALYGDSTDYQNWVEVFINGVRYDFNDASHGWTITSPSGSLSTLARPITNAVLTFNAVQTGTVQIVGARRPRRTAQFSENAGVSARNLNQVFTDIISQNREIWDKNNDMTGRGLFSQPGNTIGPLPLPAACVGKYLGFDATGLNPICNTGGPGSGNVNGLGSSVAGNVPIYADTSGGVIQDSGKKPVTPLTCSASNWFRTLSAGVLGCSQPNFTDLAGSIAGAQIPASTITSAMIADGTIVDADVNASAGIAISKLATQSANTTVCNPTGGAAVPVACTQAQLTTQVNVATPSVSGAVPALPNTGTKFFRDDGTYQIPPSAGQMILLNTLTASASTSLSDTTNLTSTYSNYEVILTNLVPATNSSQCIIAVNVGGVQTTNYKGTINITSTVPATGTAATTTYIPCGSTTNVLNSGSGVSGRFRIPNPSQTASPKFILGEISYPISGGTDYNAGYFGGAYIGTNGAVTGIQLCFGTAVPTCLANGITSGTMKIYGIQ